MGAGEGREGEVVVGGEGLDAGCWWRGRRGEGRGGEERRGEGRGGKGRRGEGRRGEGRRVVLSLVVPSPSSMVRQDILRCHTLP